MTARERIFALEQFGIKLGLDHIRLILDALARPDHAWPAVHIAGTNGKGSVTAMVERGLREAGHRTGRYTSPHLDRIEERIAIDGQPVEPALFDAVAAETMAIVDELRGAGALEAWPTFFEVTTAIAFEIFRRRDVDVAVVEVGLGGRFDATNVLTPLVTAITSIALDHQRHLGTTIPQIAREKAGIIKPAVPVVLGEVPHAARAVIMEEASRRAAPVVSAGMDYVTQSQLVVGRASIDLRTPRGEYSGVTLGLNGEHQIANAVVAARILETCNTQGLRTRPSDIVAGLTDVEWPARLEWLRLRPHQHVLVDAAHNPAGAKALADYLRAADAAPLPLVLAVMRDKDIDAIILELAPVASGFVATEVASPRCTKATDLAERLTRLVPQVDVLSRPNPQSAIDAGLSRSDRIAVAGSIFLVGPLRAELIERGATPVRYSSGGLPLFRS
jgi:dihydrofolate synthase / folylpolyglutamate synthase